MLDWSSLSSKLNGNSKLFSVLDRRLQSWCRWKDNIIIPNATPWAKKGYKFSCLNKQNKFGEYSFLMWDSR